MNGYDFESLETPISELLTRVESTNSERYPCEYCGGTGEYRGVRLHQPRSECFACRGRGSFKTSRSDRLKAREQRQARKAKKEQERVNEFSEEHPGLVEFLEGAASWSGFASDMLASLRKYGSLTERQLSAVSSMMAKSEQRKKERQPEKPLDFDLQPLFNLFNSASGSGLKRPRLTIHSVTVSRAPDNGANAGCLYVKRNGEYAGKVTPAGELRIIRDMAEHREEITKTLESIAADPLGFATAYGKETGICCCCNRELTDPVSVAAGIGPICAGKWGL